MHCIGLKGKTPSVINGANKCKLMEGYSLCRQMRVCSKSSNFSAKKLPMSSRSFAFYHFILDAFWHKKKTYNISERALFRAVDVIFLLTGAAKLSNCKLLFTGCSSANDCELPVSNWVLVNLQHFNIQNYCCRMK